MIIRTQVAQAASFQSSTCIFSSRRLAATLFIMAKSTLPCVKAHYGCDRTEVDNTYFLIDSETALGADNEDTYTVSGGFRHSF